MANKKISELPIVTSPNDDDTFISNHLGSTYSVKLSGIADFVKTYIDNNNPVTPPPTNNVFVTTLAGSIEGLADGPGTYAQFNKTTGVAVGYRGNVYVADGFNNKIRNIGSTGEVSSPFGPLGFDNNTTGSGPQLISPYGVSSKYGGGVYFTDVGNHKIRMTAPEDVVVPSGTVFFKFTTFAGSTAGYADGIGTAAKFNRPTGLASGYGGLYVADTYNHKIRKITLAGVVTTLAGVFKFPTGVAVDSSGNVYVGDTGNHKIRKITPQGVVTTLAGSTQGYADGTGTAARFYNPDGVAVDSSGNVYVGDTGNNIIRKITPAGVVSTLAGDGTRGYADGTGTAAKFNRPAGVAVDSSGNVYVADFGNYRIRKITTI